MEVRRHINIFVGLGGTGSSVVNKLYHRIPRGGGFGYVIYDADIQVKPEGFPEDYFCPTVTERINAQEVCEEYRDVNRNGDFAREFNKYWPGCRVGADKCLYVDYFDATGLGQSRPKGFLGFLYHYNNAPENIVAKIERITANLGGVQEQNLSTIAGAVNIRIICSFAGGTGSGAFLDLAFLLKHLHPNFKIYGYFILGKAAMLGRTDSFSKDYLRAMANTYGALWELKYWMTSGRIFQKCYGENRCISLGRPPFDNVYLIDQNNGMNQNLTHWKKYEDLLADCLYDKLHRTLVSSEVQTVLNNNEAEGTILSMGRGILLYPRKDILRLLGLYLMRDYIEKYIAKQKDDEIRAQVPADIKTLNLLDEEGADHIKTGMMHFRLQGLTIPKFPFLIRDTLTRAMKEHNYESNLNAVDKEINNAIIQAQNYYNNVFPHYLQNKQNEFLKRFSNEVAKQGVSFLHGYLDNFIKYIESRIGAHKADTGFLADLYQARDNLTYKISVVKENRGKNRRANEELFKAYENYYNVEIGSRLREKKLEFYNNFLSFLRALKNAVNFVHDYIKKDTILGKIRGMIFSLEYEASESSLYPEYATTIKVLSIGENLRKYQEIYDQFMRDENNAEQRQKLFEEYETGLRDFLINKALPEYLGHDKIDAIKENLLKEELEKLAFGDFGKVFVKSIPENIFEALFLDSQKKKMSYEEYFVSILNRLKTELATPFLRQKEKKNLSRSSFIAGNLNLFRSTIAKLVQKYNIRIDSERIINEIKIDSPEEEMTDQILCFTVQHGYDLGLIEDFQESPHTYYNSYQNVNREQDEEYRYEVFIDLRHNPRGLPATLLFLLCEYAGIIHKVIDKTENETGVYRFGKDVLKKGLRGRENNIKWFVNNEDPDKRNRILGEFKKNIWQKITPDQRQKYFEDVMKGLQKAKDKVTDENLKNIYEANIKVMEEAINARYFEREDITSLI